MLVISFSSSIARRPVTSSTPVSSKRACKPAAHYEPSMIVHLPVNKCTTTPNQFFTPPTHRRPASNYHPMPRYVTESSSTAELLANMDQKPTKREFVVEEKAKSVPKIRNREAVAGSDHFHPTLKLEQSIVLNVQHPVACSLSSDNFVNTEVDTFSEPESMSGLLRRVMALEENNIQSLAKSVESSEKEADVVEIFFSECTVLVSSHRSC